MGYGIEGFDDYMESLSLDWQIELKSVKHHTTGDFLTNFQCTNASHLKVMFIITGLLSHNLEQNSEKSLAVADHQ